MSVKEKEAAPCNLTIRDRRRNGHPQWLGGGEKNSGGKNDLVALKEGFRQLVGTQNAKIPSPCDTPLPF